MSLRPTIFLDDKDINIAQFHRYDGVEWPFTVRMTLRFANDKYALNAKHTHHLLWLAAVCQQGDRIIESYGLADRKGERGYNLALSKRRILAVVDRLTSFGVPRDKFDSKLTKALGEDFPEAFGKENDRPDAQDRAVVVFAWVNLGDFIGIGSSLPVCKFARGGLGIPVL